MKDTQYIYSTRALIWFSPDADILTINIFDISRNELDALPNLDQEHMIEADDLAGIKPMWAKNIKPTKGFLLTMYTNEPPVEGGEP